MVFLKIIAFFLTYSRFWAKFFDITTFDLIKRITASLCFFTPQLVNTIGNNPDLYGPFWIYTTLIFVLSGSSNFSNYFKQHKTAKDKDQSTFAFDF
jgi:protein YIPF1/2